MRQEPDARPPRPASLSCPWRGGCPGGQRLRGCGAAVAGGGAGKRICPKRTPGRARAGRGAPDLGQGERPHRESCPRAAIGRGPDRPARRICPNGTPRLRAGARQGHRHPAHGICPNRAPRALPRTSRGRSLPIPGICPNRTLRPATGAGQRPRHPDRGICPNHAAPPGRMGHGHRRLIEWICPNIARRAHADADQRCRPTHRPCPNCKPRPWASRRHPAPGICPNRAWRAHPEAGQRCRPTRRVHPNRNPRSRTSAGHSTCRVRPKPARPRRRLRPAAPGPARGRSCRPAAAPPRPG